MTPTKTVRPDAKGRITLGALAKDVSGYQVNVEENGRVILEPLVEIPAQEKWVFGNPAVKNALLNGLKDSAEGRVQERGGFAQYAEE